MKEEGLENQLQNSYIYHKLAKGTQIKLFLIN